MQLSKLLEQSIAVFGESGSGKTVLLSSFYGGFQEPRFMKDSLFNVVADQVGQGSRLHQNYLEMKDSARLPAANRFSATSYSFSIKFKKGHDVKAAKSRAFDALRVTWHDYPGEWFEQDVSGGEEAQRRVDTFRSLIGSDVALLLVDAQKMADNAGEEERYLRSLLGNFRNGLLALRDDLLTDGKPLVEFPRIWMLGLSKSDLLPDVDAYSFRDLVIGKAGDDLQELRSTIASFVEAPGALAVGEDFVLLSSAKFSSDVIRVDERVGINLILPIAAVLPFERHVKWVKAKQIPVKLAEKLVGVGAVGAEALAAVLLNVKLPLPGRLDAIRKFLGAILTKEAVEKAAELAGEKLKELNAEALRTHNYLTATLTQFQIDLETAEGKKALLRSAR